MLHEKGLALPGVSLQLREECPEAAVHARVAAGRCRGAHAHAVAHARVDAAQREVERAILERRNAGQAPCRHVRRGADREARANEGTVARRRVLRERVEAMLDGRERRAVGELALV